MLKNYFKTAIRTILREKYFSLINIVGLALGISVCLIIYSYVIYETSFDKFHTDIERIYRVNQTNIWDSGGGMMGSTGPQLALVLASDYPEIEESLRINTPGEYLVRYSKPDGQMMAFNEGNIYAADSNFFNFFTIPLKEGNPKTALQGLNKVVISGEVAKKYFGDEPALGKTLQFGESRRLVEVTGVTEEQPDNSHFQFDYLISIYTNPNVKRFEWSWIWTQDATYVKLAQGVDVSALEKKFANIVSLYVKPSFNTHGIVYEDFMNGKDEWQFELQPMQSIHLYSEETGNRIGSVGDIKYVNIFSLVAVFVLLLAIINFINLLTARGTARTKEVGVKKAMGALRRSLIFQFQLESVLTAAIATALGLGLLEIFRILITNLLEVDFPFGLGGSINTVLLLIGIPIIVGSLAGFYPALYLTSFKPAHVLKGKMEVGSKMGLRNVLVTAQFVISMVFIIATIMVNKQLNYFQSKNLGFNKDNILIVNNAEKISDQVKSFRDEISQLPGVINASVAMTLPGRGSFEDIFMKYEDGSQLSISQTKIDQHYFETLGLSLVAGRTFDPDRPADRLKVIPNETTVRAFGWSPEEALGKIISYPDFGDPNQGAGEIIGVVKDFNFVSLRNDIEPAIFYHIDGDIWEIGKVVAIKFQGQQTSEIISAMKEKWSLLTDAPFEYSFLDQEWARQYQQEQRLAGLFSIFAGLSILIAMIGLIGLVTYAAEKRKKEIGLRKVLGASVGQVVFLLNRNFTILVLTSFVIAVPLGWYAMDSWLNQFPYRTPIELTSFLLAGATMLIITWITVAYQSIKAGLTNPVDVLKDE